MSISEGKKAVKAIGVVRSVKLSDFTEPLYLAHRGGASVYPENTLEAFKLVNACGIKFLETDVQTLKDGALALMHDDTINRTTSGTGNVIDQTSMSWQNLAVDSASWHSNTNFGNLKAPFLEDLLRAFEDRVIYVPESKDQKSAQNLVNIFKAYKLEKNVIIQVSIPSEAPVVVNSGMPCLYIAGAEEASFIKGLGVKYVGVNKTSTDEYIASLIAIGLKVIVFTVNTHKERDVLLDKGVHGFFSDDPVYLSGSSYKTNKDPFATGQIYHGHISTLGGLGVWTNGRWGFTTAGQTRFVCQGWACPLTNAASSYAIQTSITYEAANGATDWANIAICTPKDFFDNNSTNSQGYNILVRANGTIDLYKVGGGTSTKIGTVNTAALVLNSAVTIKIEVTPTTIKVTRVDTGDNFTVTDSAYRGGYFHFGLFNIGATFSNASIT